MSPQTNQDPANPRRGPDPVGLVYRLAAGHAACLTVFTRRRFGAEAFRVDGPVAMGVILLYGGATGAYAMWPFFWVWLTALVVRRVETGLDRLRGRGGHSRYGGWPWLAVRVSRAKGEEAAKAGVEPALCLVAGFGLLWLSPALGAFVAFGCFSLLAKTGIERLVFDARLRALRDAAIENEQLADAFDAGGHRGR